MTNRITIDSHGTSVESELFSPAGAPTGGVIIVAHGSDGMTEPWAAMIREYAISLAAKGFTTLIPNYFEKDGNQSWPPGILGIGGEAAVLGRGRQ